MENITTVLRKILNGFIPIIMTGDSKSMKRIRENDTHLHNGKTDLYFYVNGGGTKQNQISQLNACFIDLDARGEDRSYLTIKQLGSRKKKMMARINEFPVSPNLIVETRNGYHVYWLINEKSDKKVQWNTIQKKIASFFKDVGGDSRAIKINQIMRIPGTYWTKFKPRFLTKIVKKNYPSFAQRLKNFDRLVKALDNQKIDMNRGYSNKSFKKVKSEFIITATISPDIEVLVNIFNFLNEVSTTLYYKGHKFMATQAKYLAEELTKKYNVS